MKKILVYTDGSSLGNPGKGGWGVIFIAGKRILELGGTFKNVTNNQMEMWALKEALKFLVEKDVQNYEIEFRIDSKYVIDGITKWIYNWKKNNWKKADKKPVLNKELWEEILNAKKLVEENNKISFTHIRGHQGEEFNERADEIARKFASGEKIKLRK